jgi:CBS domain-containing protein
MKIRELLRRPVVSAPSESSVKDVAGLMGKENVGLVVLIDAAQRLAGVVSERDIIRAVASGSDLRGSAVQIATRNVVTVDAASDILEAAKLINKHHIRHVVAVTDGKPLGVVSVRDLVAERATLRALVESYAQEPFPGGD